MKIYSDIPEYETINLEVIKYLISQDFGLFFFSSTDFKIEHALQSLVIQMRSHILGQHHYQEYTVMQPIPANWWETFKEEKMPDWYKKRYPVKRRFARHTITFDHKLLFPGIDKKFPPEFGTIVFHSHSNDIGVIPGGVDGQKYIPDGENEL